MSSATDMSAGLDRLDEERIYRAHVADCYTVARREVFDLETADGPEPLARTPRQDVALARLDAAERELTAFRLARFEPPVPCAP
jgi:hypothetical protein